MIMFNSERATLENLFDGFSLTLQTDTASLIIKCTGEKECSFSLSSDSFVEFSPLLTDDFEFLKERFDVSVFSECIPMYNLMPTLLFFKDFLIENIFEDIFIHS